MTLSHSRSIQDEIICDPSVINISALWAVVDDPTVIKPRHAAIMRLRYAENGDAIRTYAAVGTIMQLSTNRVRDVVRVVLRRLTRPRSARTFIAFDNTGNTVYNQSD